MSDECGGVDRREKKKKSQDEMSEIWGKIQRVMGRIGQLDKELEGQIIK